jgi:hypothetical protein
MFRGNTTGGPTNFRITKSKYNWKSDHFKFQWICSTTVQQQPVNKKDPVKSHMTHLIERQCSTTVEQQTS